MGPLNGLTVVEMAGLGPCPFAGQMLADLGASVIVVDRQAGDDLSREVNRRGKRSIALDLKSQGGKEIVLRLAGKADVLIEGYRPGVMERLGLGPRETCARNSRLVYGRMTGWGQHGPLAASAGHDITYLAITGALHAMGEADKPPVPPLNLVADYGGGSMMLVAGVLAALVERGVSGKGQVVDAAMVDGVPAMLGLLFSMRAGGLWSERRADNLLDGAAPFYRCYEAGDGKFVAVGALEPQFFAVLIEKSGMDPDWCTAQMDKRRWPEMTRAFARAFAARTRDEWAAIFEGTDGCVAPVLDFDEAAVHPHNASRDVFRERNGVMQAAPAPRFSRSECAMPDPAGISGADREEVLSHLGFSPDEMARLRAEGALQ
jgi:alpha-methylacyl-CoA racemase